jgi:tetratricopeptide (TPR) repeat protein
MSEHFISREDAEADVLSCAAYVAERIEPGDDHSDAMRAVVQRYLDAGNVDMAAEFANTVDDPFVRDRLLIAVAGKCAEIDDDEYAHQLADAIDDPGLRSEGIERIGMVKAGKGQFDAARKIADEMAHPEFVLASIAVRQARDGNSDMASETIGEIAFPAARVNARGTIAQAAIADGSAGPAVDGLELAVTDAAEIEHDEERVRSLIELGNLYIEAGRNDKAVCTLDSAREHAELLESIHRDAFFGSISVGLLRAGSEDLSDRALDLVADKTAMANALLGHARHFWRTDRKDDALEALDESYEVLRSQRDSETRSSRERFGLFTAIATQFAGFDKGERAIEIAEAIEDEEQSMVALSQIARVCEFQGNDELARQALNAIADNGQRAFALIGMSDEAVKLDKKDKAAALLTEALDAVDDVPQMTFRASAIAEITDRAAKLDLDESLDAAVGKLFETIRTMRSRVGKATSLVSLSELVDRHELELSEPEFEQLRGIVLSVR